MATINFSFTVPDDKAQDILDTIAAYKGYNSTVLDEGGVEVPNPQTKIQFLRSMVREEIREWYISGKGSTADYHRIDAMEEAETVSIT